MITNIPENWTYSDDLEMLFYFYQCTDELLSETSPDSFALPLHNTITLINELTETYSLLKKYDIVKEYYERYIPPIIDEFFNSMTEDYVLKSMLGERLESILTGFEESKKTSVHLKKWLNIFMQSCGIGQYINNYKSEIIYLVSQTKDKDKLYYCLKSFYISILDMGYSREFVYTTAKRFFNNKSITINDPRQCREFLDNFIFERRQFNFLVLMDMDSVEYLGSISDDITLSLNIKKIDIEAERKELCRDVVACELFKQFDTKRNYKSDHKKIAIVRFVDQELDPYKSAMKFCDYISFLQTFKRYFIHHNYSKQVYTILLQKPDQSYVHLHIPNKLRKRPFVDQTLIDRRVLNILEGSSFGSSAFSSLAQALEMHADAFDSKNTITLFRSLWTALETLFSNPNPNTTRDNVINSTLSIVQKTYILKTLRAIYSQITDAIPSEQLKENDITDFASFVEYFASFDENSPEMKILYNHLTNNPLLRSRLFNTRKKLKDGKHIAKLLEHHKTRVEWQLNRLYRIRNIATHLGQEASTAEYAVNHLHNYFDYVVNYMLCKTELGNYIADISTLVFEAKNDLRIQAELLKENQKLSKDNYKLYLFGPDPEMINYKFEH